MAAPQVISLIDMEGGREAVEELRNHFARVPRWEFETPLQEGANGVVVRIKKRRTFGGIQRLAVKRALGEMEEGDLRNEIKWLKRLRGAEHIAGLVTARDDINERNRNDDTKDSGESDDGDSETNGNAAQIPDQKNSKRGKTLCGLIRGLLFRPANHYLVGLNGPVVVMEYLDNGTLGRLIERARTHDIHLPNRMLWSLFLCSLAYPVSAGRRDPTRLETIPSDGRQPSTIQHGDLHIGNIMIGDPGGRFPEHAIVPVAKFIDFGSALETPAGIINNMQKISIRMLNLIARGDVKCLRNRSRYNGLETLATEILPTGNGAKYPHLDPELRDFLARCLAQQPNDRPALDEMLRVTEQAVRTKRAESYALPQQARETDEAILDVVRRLIYDAGTISSSTVPTRNTTWWPFSMGIFEIPAHLDRFWIFR